MDSLFQFLALHACNTFWLQPVILDYLASKIISSKDLVVVSPDVGGVARARAFAKKLSDAPLAIVDKRRQSHNVSEVLNVEQISIIFLIVFTLFIFSNHLSCLFLSLLGLCFLNLLLSSSYGVL